jgi:ribose transport system permease protein
MGRIWRVFGQQTGLWILAGIFLFFTFSVGETFLSVGNMENVARQISLDAPVVFGEAVVLIAGGIDISVGSNMAMAGAITMGLQPLGTPVAVLAALLFGVLIGAVNGLLVTKGKIVPFIATLGTMSLVRGLLLTYTHQQPIPGTDSEFSFWGAGNIGFIPVPLIVTLLLMLALVIFLKYSRSGRNLYAIGGNKEAAHVAGISVDKSMFTAFVISGFTSALSGVLLASRLNSATVQVGNDTPLLALAAAIIGGASLLGGRGTIVGAFIGVLALGMLTNGMNLLGVLTYYQIAFRALILIAVVAIDAFSGNLTRRRLAMANAMRSKTTGNTTERKEDKDGLAPSGP